MRFGSYVLLMFSIAFAFTLFGQTSAIAYVLGWENKQTPLDSSGNPVYNNQLTDSSDFLARMGQILSSQSSIQTLLGLGVVAIGAAALTGFSSMYFIPLILLVLLSPYLLMPVGMFLDDPACQVFSPAGVGSVYGSSPSYPLTIGSSTFANASAITVAWESCKSASKFSLPYADVIRLFLNIITILAIVSFVRGGV